MLQYIYAYLYIFKKISIQSGSRNIFISSLCVLLIKKSARAEMSYNYFSNAL